MRIQYRSMLVSQTEPRLFLESLALCIGKGGLQVSTADRSRLVFIEGSTVRNSQGMEFTAMAEYVFGSPLEAVAALAFFNEKLEAHREANKPKEITL